MPIFLKKLKLNKDITKKYLNWINDPDINKYTEQRFKRKKLHDIKKFVIEKNISKTEYLYGIFLKSGNVHIGNIKLGPINQNHKTAFISYFIGEKELQNKGYGKRAIELVCNIAKKKKIKKIKAGCFSINLPSIQVLKKNGFKLEARLKKELVFNKKRYDQCILSKFL